MEKTRVLILGGGFGGVYTALEFEKRRDPDFEVTVLSGDNYFLFTPMLHEVAASDLDVRAVTILHGFDHHSHVIEFEHLVCALGSTTNFYNIPGLEQRAVTMKSLDDAINLRNRLIAHLEAMRLQRSYSQSAGRSRSMNNFGPTISTKSVAWSGLGF